MGSEECIGIYDLAKLVGKLMHNEEITITKDSTRVRPWEIWHLQSCNDKLYNALGDSRNRIRTPLIEALKKTIDYFYKNGSKWDW